MNKIWTMAATAILCWAGIVQAGPLDKKNVAADAKWVAHVNLDAARSSQVVQKFFQQCLKDLPGAKERFHQLAHECGLEQCTKMHGITAYGSDLGSHGKVVILHADWDTKALQKKAEKAPDHKLADHGKHKIHTFTAHKGTKHAHEVAASLFKPDILVLASSQKRLTAALDVLDGKGANLAGSKSLLTAKVSEGTILLFRALELKDSKAAKRHPALGLINSFCYEKGEHDGKWFGNVTVAADSHGTAEKVRKVIEGYGAWLSLHSHKSPWFVDLLNKTKLTVDGNAVQVKFEEKADALASHMPELCQAMQEHVKMMKMRHYGTTDKHKSACDASPVKPSATPATCPGTKKKDTGTAASKEVKKESCTTTSKETKKETGAAAKKPAK